MLASVIAVEVKLRLVPHAVIRLLQDPIFHAVAERVVSVNLGKSGAPGIIAGPGKAAAIVGPEVAGNSGDIGERAPGQFGCEAGREAELGDVETGPGIVVRLLVTADIEVQVENLGGI